MLEAHQFFLLVCFSASVLKAGHQSLEKTSPVLLCGGISDELRVEEEVVDDPGLRTSEEEGGRQNELMERLEGGILMKERQKRVREGSGRCHGWLRENEGSGVAKKWKEGGKEGKG